MVILMYSFIVNQSINSKISKQRSKNSVESLPNYNKKTLKIIIPSSHNPFKMMIVIPIAASALLNSMRESKIPNRKRLKTNWKKKRKCTANASKICKKQSKTWKNKWRSPKNLKKFKNTRNPKSPLQKNPQKSPKSPQTPCLKVS